MFISPYIMVPDSVIPGLYLPLALRHVGPNSKCHVTSPHGIKALFRAENTNRWLKCLQHDFPQQPGRCRVLPVVMGCSICSAKMPRGRAVPVPTMPTEGLLQYWLSAVFAEDHLLLKNMLTPLVTSLASLAFHHPKWAFIYIQYFSKKAEEWGLFGNRQASDSSDSIWACGFSQSLISGLTKA